MEELSSTSTIFKDFQGLERVKKNARTLKDLWESPSPFKSEPVLSLLHGNPDLIVNYTEHCIGVTLGLSTAVIANSSCLSLASCINEQLSSFA
jgi:hypothetical protein